jgi:hypothetical protein
MTNDQIKRLLQQALRKANTDGPCYDVAKLVIQIELIISMLDDQVVTAMMRDTGKDIGDIK